MSTGDLDGFIRPLLNLFLGTNECRGVRKTECLTFWGIEAKRLESAPLVIMIEVRFWPSSAYRVPSGNLCVHDVVRLCLNANGDLRNGLSSICDCQSGDELYS